MTVMQITILCFVFLMCVLSVLIFYFQNKKQQQTHLQTVKIYTEDIAKNKMQISVRNSFLHSYNFTKQNLKEALHVQQEIDLSCC